MKSTTQDQQYKSQFWRPSLLALKSLDERELTTLAALFKECRGQDDDHWFWQIQGYPDDEGVQLNRGRPGAAYGPQEIRRWLYRMQRHNILPGFDRGDMLQNWPLDERHRIAQAAGLEALNQKRLLVTIGGGHDYAHPDGAALIEAFPHQAPLIINIDAHLDVRPPDPPLNSGTAFRRLRSDYPTVEIWQIGYQNLCNSPMGLNYCSTQKFQMPQHQASELLHLNLETWAPWFAQTSTEPNQAKRPCFLSIDMDAFSLHFAQGTSQAWPIGIDARAFYFWMLELLRHVDLKVIGLYETSPRHDVGHTTAKLAAQFIYAVLEHISAQKLTHINQ